MTDLPLTRAQGKALITAFLELQAQMRQVLGAIETMMADDYMRDETLKHLRVTSDHVLRLVRQKEVLLQALGQVALEVNDATMASMRQRYDELMREH
jgi:hypothetical protein